MTEALGAALRTAAMEIAVQAAAEIRAQLPDHTGEVVLSDCDPALRIAERSGVVAPCPAAQDPDARITLRLPPSLEQRIEDSAQPTGSP